jgi:RNA polymerase sigma factor (sigma-70 family)
VSPASDDELLQRARNADVPAFEELVARNRDRVFGIALRILHSEAEAAEVAQETFLAAWRSLDQLSGNQFSHWVARIAANRSLMKLRHQKVANQVEESMESPQFNARGSLVESVADWAPTGAARLGKAGLPAARRRGARLPADQRDHERFDSGAEEPAAPGTTGHACSHRPVLFREGQRRMKRATGKGIYTGPEDAHL